MLFALSVVAGAGCSIEPVALQPVEERPNRDAGPPDGDGPYDAEVTDAGDASPDLADVPTPRDAGADAGPVDVGSSDAGDPACVVEAVITDGRLDPSAWSHGIVEGRSRGRRIGYVSAQATDPATGNVFRRVAMDVAGGEEIWVAHWHRDAVWRATDHPRPCGVEVAAAISDVDQTPSSRHAILTLIAEQDGRVYWTERLFVNVEGWRAWSPPATIDDFRPFDPAEGPPISLDDDAGPVRFGFAVGASRPAGLGLTTTTYRVDDFDWSISAAR